MHKLFFLPKLIEHKIAGAETDAVTAKMYEYVMFGNGLFIRAKRSEFTACLPLCKQTVKGLPEAKAEIVWHKPKISRAIWRQILEHARDNTDPDNFTESIYVVRWRDDLSDWFWTALSRERHFAQTIAEDSRIEYGEACLELHTHPPGALHFSRADDADETGKFRIFGILTDIHAAAKIRFRCGVYDYFEQIPADWVGEMPAEIADLNDLKESKLLYLKRK